MSIVVKNLTKIYKNKKVLNNISFEIKSGEIVGLLGVNGAGKSTLMKIISCFVEQDNGEVVVVSNYDKSGSSTGWSRSGKGALSDRMEIYAVTVDGGRLIRITNNEAGDWLPKWRPNRTQLIFESNRDGNSEIYAATPSSSWRHRFTERSSSDQSPVWGENGIVAAFSSDVSGKSEIRVVEIWQDLAKYETNADLSTGQVGIPIPHQG